MTHVSKRIKSRREQRQGRRFRKRPYRKNRINRTQGGISPSTRARWGLKLRILNWLSKIYPISHVVVEDIKAWTRKGSKRWNRSFSPLEVGKQWFYDEIERRWTLFIKAGYETKQLRDMLGLKKSFNKKSDSFEAHCVDSWVLANCIVEGHDVPDDTDIVHIVPYQLHRRQLHRLQPSKGGKRSRYSGTISMGIKRGRWVRHIKYGLCFVGGFQKQRLSLHSLATGKRITLSAKLEDLTMLCFSGWRTRSAVASTP